MKMNRLSLFSAAAVLGLVASLTCGTRAQADDLNLGGNYNTFSWTLSYSGFSASNEGGGSIGPSTLNGVALPWVYCIDIPDNVGVPADYKNTVVTSNGSAWYGASNPWTKTAGVITAGNSLTVAGQIAWILDNYASTATSVALQEAVQAAIWKVIYDQNGKTYFQVQDTGVNNASNSIITAMGSKTASVSSILWMSPNGSGNQALVTAVPEPSTFAIASVCGAGFVFYGLRRRRKAMGA